MKSVVYLIVSAVLGALGQLQFKRAALGIAAVRGDPHGVSWIGVLAGYLESFTLWLGVALYVLSTIFWLLGLTRVPLNYAYPFTLLTFVLVLSLSVIVLHEPFSRGQMLGASLICVGLLVASFST